MRNVLVIAPHADDEVLGAGATIARCVSEGATVTVAIVTRGYAPHFNEDVVKKALAEAKAAHQILGVNETLLLDFPAAALDTIAQRELNARIEEVIVKTRPDTLFVPFAHDIHNDHRLVFMASLVAARPHRAFAPKRVLAYETLSETNWNAPYLAPAFVPNVFVDVTRFIGQKLEALKQFESQLMPFPQERSLGAVEHLAALRGAAVNVEAAEAFVLIRQKI
jgi:LmbE family N-acetylglucosaminyl deacetylase